MFEPWSQALKLTDDAQREEAVLDCLHRALEYAVQGATQFLSIQCVVLCVFTLHCCRGRGTPEQKQQRQAWHAALADRLPAGDKAAWAALPWVDPRTESHSTADRFGFEWSPKVWRGARCWLPAAGCRGSKLGCHRCCCG